MQEELKVLLETIEIQSKLIQGNTNLILKLANCDRVQNRLNAQMIQRITDLEDTLKEIAKCSN